jgi:hypothetical protein
LGLVAYGKATNLHFTRETKNRLPLGGELHQEADAVWSEKLLETGSNAMPR